MRRNLLHAAIVLAAFLWAFSAAPGNEGVFPRVIPGLLLAFCAWSGVQIFHSLWAFLKNRP